MTGASKAELRRSLRRRRDALSADQLIRISAQVARRVLTLDAVRSGEVVASYSPIGSEIDTRKIHEELDRLVVRVALPRVRDNDLELVVVDASTIYKRSSLGVSEPQGPACNPGSLSAIIVPGLAFDRRGHRLGYGRGFYDRLLARSSAPTIGICADEFLIPALPTDPHDRRVDQVVTPLEIFDVA